MPSVWFSKGRLEKLSFRGVRVLLGTFGGRNWCGFWMGRWIMIFFFFWVFAVVGESTRLQLSHGLQVNTSTGSKPGTSVVCERVHIRGLPRLKNLGKIAHVVKVNVSQRDPSIRTSKTEVCFHRWVIISCGFHTWLCIPKDWFDWMGKIGFCSIIPYSWGYNSF